jgi:hypothetical protein
MTAFTITKHLKNSCIIWYSKLSPLSRVKALFIKAFLMERVCMPYGR